MIHLRGASFVYQAPDGEVEALRQVDMDIAPGEFCSVVGPSGCGKSTLLSVISGLERLTSGTVEVDGAAVCGPSDKIGLMPQRDQLFPWRTIRDNVTLGLSVLGKRTPENLAYADTLLRRYGLWDFARKRPAQLSGGMRQRCWMSRFRRWISRPGSRCPQTSAASSAGRARPRFWSPMIFPRPSASRTAFSCSVPGPPW